MRSFGNRGADMKVVARLIGTLFIRTVERAERIYSAMLSRGFHGDFRTISRFRATLVDYLWLFAVSVASCVLVLLDKGGVW
jgi:cobalt/nickel transport system permease protein